MWQQLFRSNFYSKSEFCERKIVSTDNWTAQLAETIAMYLLLITLLNCIQCNFKTQLICILFLNNMWNNESWGVNSRVQSWPCLKFHYLHTMCIVWKLCKRQGQNWIRCMVVGGMVKSIVNRKRMWSKLTFPNRRCDKCLLSNSQLYMLDIVWWSAIIFSLILVKVANLVPELGLSFIKLQNQDIQIWRCKCWPLTATAPQRITTLISIRGI